MSKFLSARGHVLVEVDGKPVFQAYIAYCAICRGPTAVTQPLQHHQKYSFHSRNILPAKNC